MTVETVEPRIDPSQPAAPSPWIEVFGAGGLALGILGIGLTLIFAAYLFYLRCTASGRQKWRPDQRYLVTDAAIRQATAVALGRVDGGGQAATPGITVGDNYLPDGTRTIRIQVDPRLVPDAPGTPRTAEAAALASRRALAPFGESPAAAPLAPGASVMAEKSAAPLPPASHLVVAPNMQLDSRQTSFFP